MAAAAAPAAVGVEACGGVAAPAAVVAPAPPEDVEVVRARLAPFRVKPTTLQEFCPPAQCQRSGACRTPWRAGGVCGRRTAPTSCRNPTQPRRTEAENAWVGTLAGGQEHPARGAYGRVSVSAACGAKPGRGGRSALRRGTVSWRPLRRSPPRCWVPAGASPAAPPPQSL